MIAGALLPYVALGQATCDCESELNFVIDYLEANVPSFQDNVDTTNQETYDLLKEKVAANAKSADSEVACFKTLTYYVEFFKDNHTSLQSYSEDVDENDSASVAKFLITDAFRLAEEYELKNVQQAHYPLDDIRGTYQSQDGRYTIMVVPDKGPYRDHVGVITESQSKLWKPSQVRMELKETDDGHWEAFVYEEDHSLRFHRDYPFVNGILGDRWFNIGLDHKVNPVVDATDSLSFRMVNDSTAYLRLPSFQKSQTKLIDSLVAAVDQKIKQTPYLIIDVRNNGGGSSENVLRLIDYYYTHPIQKDRVELYVTEGNIKKYERLYNEVSQDTANSSEGLRSWVRQIVRRMKDAPLHSYLLLSEEEDHITHDSVFAMPRKVAVLYNKYCASSCELLLFWARDSDKTTLVGENSGGYVGYGSAQVAKTPCYGFSFPTTTTRYQKSRQYEADGIPPDYTLSNDSDWIEQTVNILAKEDTTNR